MAAPNVDCTGYGSIRDCLFYAHGFGYRPLMPVAIGHAVQFAVATACIAYVVTKARGAKWSSTHLVTITGVMEVAGYALRAWVAKDAQLMPLVTTNFFLLVAPIVMIATIYSLMGRLLQAAGGKIGCIPARWVGRVFLFSDIFSFVIQGSGGGLSAMTDPAKQKIGSNLVLVGLSVQIAVFALFALALGVVTAVPAYRLRRVAALRRSYVGLYIITGLVFVRNLFRVVESLGKSGEAPVALSEGIFTACETLPILFSMIAFVYFNFDAAIPATPEALAKMVEDGQAAAAASKEVALEYGTALAVSPNPAGAAVAPAPADAQTV